MTELITVTVAATGEKKVVEYYTHAEFIERKRNKLTELRMEAAQLRYANTKVMSPIEIVAHSCRLMSILAEWNQVRSAVGPMVVEIGVKVAGNAKTYDRNEDIEHKER